MSKIVKSTRTVEEHVDNVLAVREAMDSGISERQMCRDLGISYATLKKYKEILVKNDLEQLSDEYQFEKRCELDSQVQSVVNKLYNLVLTLEKKYEEDVSEINKLSADKEQKIDEKVVLQLRRLTKYPVGEIASVQKLILDAVDLRTRIWGLDKDNKAGTQIQNNKKIVLNINQKVSSDVDKLNSIADSIVGNNDGMRV